MSDRERRRENESPGGPSGPEGNDGGSENLGELRRAADAFLRAGEDAIRRALSQNSEAFLAASKQAGGQ